MKTLKLLLATLATSVMLVAYDYSVLLYGGFVSNMKETLTYKKSDETDIRIKDVELSTKPLTWPVYYGLRLTKWDDVTAWEVEHTHQKLYIANSKLTGKLEHWEMTDGFNFFFVNRAWQLNEEWGDTVFRVGSGLLITHPDITYNREHFHGKGHGPLTFGTGYDLSGFVIQAGLQKIFDINEEWFFSAEARVTYASGWSEDVGKGISVIQNRALHLNYGIGYKF